MYFSSVFCLVKAKEGTKGEERGERGKKGGKGNGREEEEGDVGRNGRSGGTSLVRCQGDGWKEKLVIHEGVAGIISIHLALIL